jgi:membrane-associated phospholipid phosphatase
VSVPTAWLRPWQTHEVALLALGMITSLALLYTRKGFNVVALEAVCSTSLYAAVLGACRGSPGRWFRVRFLASYAFVVWFYCAVGRFTPALGTPLRDGTLLAMDQAVFGQTPALFFENVSTGWLTDLLSVCYLTYHFYLIVAVVHAALTPNFATQRLGIYLFTGFAVGFAGYLLVPAVGPALTYPELFRTPLPGGLVSRQIGEMVQAGSSGYDVFPSLHVLITCILLDHDWRNLRRRFWILIVPSIGLMISTVYLRYHYGVDVLAGLLLFLALRSTFMAFGLLEPGRSK